MSRSQFDSCFTSWSWAWSWAWAWSWSWLGVRLVLGLVLRSVCGFTRDDICHSVSDVSRDACDELAGAGRRCARCRGDTRGLELRCPQSQRRPVPGVLEVQVLVGIVFAFLLSTSAVLLVVLCTLLAVAWMLTMDTIGTEKCFRTSIKCSLQWFTPGCWGYWCLG